MREQGLQKTVILSFALHVGVFLVAFLILRQQDLFIVPSPYTVSLIAPGQTSSSFSKSEHSPQTVSEPEKSSARERMRETPPKEKDLVRERIAALEAKEKLKKIVGLRRMIDLNAKKGGSMHGTVSQGKGAVSDSYYSTITKEIWEHWDWPGIGGKEIEAIVAIRILRDGTALVQKMEKSSGNTLFDRSVLKALAKASPLTPPPHEMEVGVRFYP
jgi:colicin import membrane protein